MSSQPSWPPFQPSSDCSQRVCTFYCPQWCYFFPPPPSFDPSGNDGDDGTSTALSPLAIALIALAAAAFILIGYYSIIYRYCRRWHHPGTGPTAVATEDDTATATAGHASPTNGLDESLINKITVHRYRRTDGLVGVTNCSVCLSEFREDESLRLLPKCSHAFHVQCIDTWLKSHPNCPLCRAGITWANPPLRSPAAYPDSDGNQPVAEREHVNEVVVALQGSGTSLGSDEEVSKGPLGARSGGGSVEERYDVIEVRGDGIQVIRQSFSIGSLCRERDSIDGSANDTGGSIESGQGSPVSDGISSSAGCRGEGSKGSSSSSSRALPHVGRSSSINHGRGRSGVLPV